MTFSILARDPQSRCFGIAIASRFFAVGAVCPFLFSGVGAFSTQSWGYPPFGVAVEPLLRSGLAPEEIIERLLETDDGRERRQLHLVDREGRVGSFTGRDCVPAAGHRSRPNLSVAGNMLASDAVLDATLDGFSSGDGFARRLLSALNAGQAAGGDKRGQQAAALIIYGSQPFPMMSLRVDDHPEAVAELNRLYDVAAADYVPFGKQFFSGAESRAVLGT